MGLLVHNQQSAIYNTYVVITSMKKDLIDFVCKKSSITEKEASKTIDIVLDGIIQGLKDKQSIKIIGFGTFKTSHYPAHQGRNPRTKEIINIPASIRISFKAGEKFKNTVNATTKK